MSPSPRASVTVDVSAVGVRAPLSHAGVARVVTAVVESRLGRSTPALVSVTFLSNRRMAALNKKHLGHAGPTDVISFGFSRPSRRDPVVGDVYIAPDVARSNARAAARPIREEIVRLVIHGALHVLGDDHPDTAREGSPMWRKQERLVERLMRTR